MELRSEENLHLTDSKHMSKKSWNVGGYVSTMAVSSSKVDPKTCRGLLLAVAIENKDAHSRRILDVQGHYKHVQKDIAGIVSIAQFPA